MKNLHFIWILFSFVFSIGIAQEEKKAGPIITNYGKVWPIENPDYKTNLETEFKAVFDIMDSPESLEDINKTIETAVRFLNMHAQSGVPKEQLKVTLVVHNKASKDIIHNEAYRSRYGVDNPNYEMVKALMDAGTEIIFCGQSSKSQNFPKEDLIQGCKISLSAMTTLIQFQSEGYQLIKF